MRLLCTSVLLVLLLAPLAQASSLDALDEALEEAQASGHEVQAQAEEALQDPEDPPAPEEVGSDLRETLRQARQQGQAVHAQTWHQLQFQIQWVEGTLQPGHAIVQDARDQVDELVVPEEAAPEEDKRPGLAPESQATMVDAWPEYAQPVMIFTGAAAGLGVLAWLIGQSATVGAGAAGTAAARDGRRFLPFASPLFTRFERDTVLGHPKREAIYGQIIGKPGITLQDLCEMSGLSRTAVTHHLRLLEQQHLVVSKRVGRSRHFFENGGRYGRHQKDAYAVLHNDRSKDIHEFIAKHPGTIQKDLCGAFDIQASVAHWHVKRLVESNLVEAVRQGRTVSYFPCGEAPQPSYA